MKKAISLISAAVLTLSSVVTSAVNAEAQSDYLPSFYMKPADSSTAMTDSSHIFVSRQQLAQGSVTVSLSVYIGDTSLLLYNVAPKMKCASEYIKLGNGQQAEPCAYDYDSLTYSALISTAEIYNTVNAKFSTVTLMSDMSLVGTPLRLTGDKSDDYPLLTFDAVLSQDIPDGEYEIYFLTQKEDDPDQPVCEVSFRYEDGSSYSAMPKVQSIFITVGDEPEFTLGDVDQDGHVDPADASLILYANAQSVSGASVLTYAQTLAADVNRDGMIDPVDAAAILTYNAECSGSDISVTFAEWAAENIK